MVRHAYIGRSDERSAAYTSTPLTTVTRRPWRPRAPTRCKFSTVWRPTSGKAPTAAEDWWRDVLTEGEHLGASGYRIALGEPQHVDVTGDHAYVVAPATMTFDLRGQQVTQTGSVYTVALRKVGEDWRLSAWAWAKGV